MLIVMLSFFLSFFLSMSLAAAAASVFYRQSRGGKAQDQMLQV
jgi:hypothetical protein